MKGKKLSLQEFKDKLQASAIERKRLFKLLCDHVAEGLSLESFALISDDTIYNYLKTYPQEFVKEELDLAFKRGREWWKGIGKAQASGTCLGNSRTWYYNMANRYGWREKIDIEAEHKGQVNVNVVSYASDKARQASVEGN